MTPEKLDELERDAAGWPEPLYAVQTENLLDLIAAARREAALREALRNVVDRVDALETNQGRYWDELRAAVRRARALLSEVPQ